jgi:hypothetical protein
MHSPKSGVKTGQWLAINGFGDGLAIKFLKALCRASPRKPPIKTTHGNRSGTGSALVICPYYYLSLLMATTATTPVAATIPSNAASPTTPTIATVLLPGIELVGETVIGASWKGGGGI